MEKPMCICCRENPVAIKKRQLCMICYHKQRKAGQLTMKEKKEHGIRFAKEVIFASVYFKTENWVYEPAMFRLPDGTKYTPDFYDQDNLVFIEVIGSRQAYEQNKEKYCLFIKTYPSIALEFRLMNGQIVDVEQEKLNFGDSVLPLKKIAPNAFFV